MKSSFDFRGYGAPTAKVALVNNKWACLNYELNEGQLIVDMTIHL